MSVFFFLQKVDNLVKEKEIHYDDKVVFDGLLSSLDTLKEIPPDVDFMFVTVPFDQPAKLAPISNVIERVCI